ncbi:uncharacterized protein MELLADRAFT_109780 [Melampsora larici-populina 98AG31]|uniref:Uncharacterized protein n=1 Tax=Melampsora larici-populina (strain 98AG31 / pathotype 3-4-7) TaxID=747676 RepID=F4RXM0_MELLP|nr:uncharacterized protein MELLADRAFT_109780 [Melampsora larici-populina 98AG31]EGG02869.1 hypothetical protein MELLADRAFT_109780 [Melampsora larici-populina 98AG31]
MNCSAISATTRTQNGQLRTRYMSKKGRLVISSICFNMIARVLFSRSVENLRINLRSRFVGFTDKSSKERDLGEVRFKERGLRPHTFALNIVDLKCAPMPESTQGAVGQSTACEIIWVQASASGWMTYDWPISSFGKDQSDEFD